MNMLNFAIDGKLPERRMSWLIDMTFKHEGLFERTVSLEWQRIMRGSLRLLCKGFFSCFN